MTPRANCVWVDFAAVKRAVSLEAVLGHYQVRGLRRRRDQLHGCCPIHHGECDDSFRAHLTKNAFQCFACQAHGNVLDFVAAMEKCSIREAALRLQQWFAVAYSPGAPAASAPNRECRSIGAVDLSFGQFWAMRNGSAGRYGSPGNEESVTYSLGDHLKTGHS